jgi:signal transduction histidine kinase
MSPFMGTQGRTLASIIRQHRDRIAGVWKDAVHKRLLHGAAGKIPATGESVHSLIDRIADDLDGIRPPKGQRSAPMHQGSVQADRESSLDELIWEYNYLRKVTARVLNEHKTLNLRDMERLNDIVDCIIGEAADSYHQKREQRRQTYTDFLHLLNSINPEAFAEPHKRRESLYRLVEGIGRNTQARSVLLYMENTQLCTLVSWSHDQPEAQTVAPQGSSAGIHGITARLEEGADALVITDVARVSAALADEGVEGVVAAPIRNQQGSIGTLMLCLERLDQTDKTLRSRVREVARQLGLVFEVVQLFDDKQSTIEALQQTQTMRDRFIAALTHDLRNPVAAALMNAQYMLLLPDDTEGHPIAARKIAESMETANRMIEDLLDAFRVSQDRELKIDPEQTDLAQLAHRAVEDLARLHGERFHLTIDGDLEGRFDPAALYRVMINLLGNAVKYGDEAGTIDFGLSGSDDAVEISIHNTGSYIPPEKQGAVFRPFERLEDSSGRRRKGWGIGLSVVVGLVGAHNGTVRVKSDPSTGTTFLVTLPRN